MKFILSLCFIAIILSTTIEAVADVKMGVFPRRPVAVTYQSFKPLADKLSKELGEKVEIVVPKDFKAFWKGVANKEFDLVHFNQYHYIKSHKEFGYQVIAANEEFGKKQIAGTLAVRKDSGINKVEDLKGKTILFGGGKKAMISYIVPTAILKKAGLVEGKDYQVEFAKNPPGAVIGVFNKAADAAGTGDIVFNVKAVSKKVDVSQLKFLSTSDPLTHLAWAVKEGMPKNKADKIQTVMTSLKNNDEGKAILKAAKVTNFYKVNDNDFAKVREFTKFAIGEDY